MKPPYHTWRFYWINLLHRSDRRAKMMDQFARLGITNHVRIDGIRVDDGVPSYAGCIRSHLHAVTVASLDLHDQTDDTIAVFLEDDIVLTEASLDNIHQCLTMLPPEWEVFQAHVIVPSMHEAVLDKFERTQTYPPNHLLRGYFMSCACYVMNARGIRKFRTSRVRPWTADRCVHPSFDFVIAGEVVIIETVMYNGFHTFTTLYSLTNTDESAQGDYHHMDTTKKQSRINYRNMVLVDRIEKERAASQSLSQPPVAASIVDIPADYHWFNCLSSAHRFLDPIWSRYVSETNHQQS